MLASVRPLWLRLAIAMVFVAPAALAGYHATHGIVKHTMRALAQRENAPIRVLTKKPVLPQPDEIERNPRARSAKLRVAERIA